MLPHPPSIHSPCNVWYICGDPTLRHLHCYAQSALFHFQVRHLVLHLAFQSQQILHLIVSGPALSLSRPKVVLLKDLCFTKCS